MTPIFGTPAKFLAPKPERERERERERIKNKENFPFDKLFFFKNVFY